MTYNEFKNRIFERATETYKKARDAGIAHRETVNNIMGGFVQTAKKFQMDFIATMQLQVRLQELLEKMQWR